ncbi:large ribosomal subunit protein bL19m [Chironomus tepperi]|uniref:large ribosomal subunit protein bL19m n=1 Tax=Chironomus tepperi TaxID=113505 RepID=UPI00391F2828
MLRKITKVNLIQNNLINTQYVIFRHLSAKAELNEATENQEKKKAKKPKKALTDMRFKYPEFLPQPDNRLRNPVLEKIMRKDMLDRRTQINIPEFYVGSILKVSTSDPHSQGKTNSFVGICIQRDRTGLYSKFALRNVIDHQGIEVMYDLYDPAILKIEVLKLEKRLDDKLIYLKDALPEYSTIDVNMEPEILAEGGNVPVNETIVKMKPFPWMQKWERQGLKGVEDLDKHLNLWRKQQKVKHDTPWEKYDLMKEYRKTITEEEQSEIFSEIFNRINKINEQHKQKAKASRRTISKPQNIG